MTISDNFFTKSLNQFEIRGFVWHERKPSSEVAVERDHVEGGESTEGCVRHIRSCEEVGVEDDVVHDEVGEMDSVRADCQPER